MMEGSGMPHTADMIFDGRKTFYEGFSLFLNTQVLAAMDSKVEGCFAKALQPVH